MAVKYLTTPNIAEDRGESLGLIELSRLPDEEKQKEKLIDLVLGLAQKPSGLKRSLSERTLFPLANLLRSMNDYYSNFIEGHNIHPIDTKHAFKTRL